MASISLSYADRAKNAQNIRSPIENTVLAISVSIPESTSTSSSFSSNASSRSSTSSNPGSSTVISSSSTDVDADITAPTTSNSSVIVESDGECNGGQQEQKKRREREEEVSRITTRKPSVNVWEQRMNRGSVSSSFTLISSSSKTSTTNSAFIKKDNDPSIAKVRPTSNNWSARPTPASPSRPVSLDLRNSNAWPEVGVGLSSPSKDKGKGKLSNEEVSVVQENENTENASLSSSKSIRAKSKSRWVPIPAEELQAAADAASTIRRQAKTQTNIKSAMNSVSRSRSRNQSQSRDLSQLMSLTRGTGISDRKSISRSGTTSNPTSSIHSSAGSAHGSPAFPREIGLPPQETEDSRSTAHTMSSSPSNSKAERTPSASTYTVPPFVSSTLPSVFPVQIQQQQQQAKFIASQNLQTGEASPHELPVGVQPVYFSNGHYPSDPIESPSVSSLSMYSPSTEQNLPQSLAPLTSHSSNLTSSLSTSYTSTYPFHGFPSIARSNAQMYWPVPTGSGHQTPNYGRQVHSSMIYPVEYRPASPINGPTHYPTHFAESHLSNPSAYVPISAPVSIEVIQPIPTRVVFGNFDGCDTNMNIGSASFTPRSSFYVGAGSRETRSSSLKKRSAQRGKKRAIPQRSAGVTMLNADAEVVDLMERFTSAKNGRGTSGRWSFGRFGNGEQDLNEDEKECAQTYNHSQQSNNSDLHLVTPPRPSLPPAYVPVGAVPVSAPAPVPPIPLSTLASLAPIHTNFPHPIPPHPSLTHLGPFSAETGPSTSPTLLMNGPGDARGGRSPEDGGFKPGAFSPHGLNNGSEWVVRDFGYGFGRERKANGMGVKESFAVDQYFSGPNHSYHGTGHGRRRGSYSYNNPYAGYGGDRGGYTPRRGGRGYGRGFRGSRRGPVHGLYGYDTDRGRENYASSPSEFRPGTYVHPSSQHHQTPFVLTPPPQFQPLPLPPTDHGLHTYIPLPRGYDSSFQPASPPVSDSESLFRAPMPAPISRLSVALDPTVYYLLGQLEYYLSPQNLAQDFFLRQQMDSHGWVPIPLIASFNRVRQITNDESFVRDVLNMSSVVEVQGDMVRMKEGEWERFVLPDAQTSRVDSIHEFPLTPSSGDSTSKVRSFVEEAVMRHVRSDNGDPESEADEINEEEEEEEEEEEDEEEVVFVMGYDPA